MKYIAVIITLVIAFVAVTSQAMMMQRENKLLKASNSELLTTVERQRLKIEFLEPQVAQWREAFVTIQQVRGVKKE